jgi:hypothetical protein
MEEPTSADALNAAVELILLEGLVQSVEAKLQCVHDELAETRQHLQEAARLCEKVRAQVRQPNPVCTDMERIQAGALALLALPSMAFLDYGMGA